MTNPLSRSRLAAALQDLINHEKGRHASMLPDSATETIQAALLFLLNPEPTTEMLEAGFDANDEAEIEAANRLVVETNSASPVLKLMQRSARVFKAYMKALTEDKND